MIRTSDATRPGNERVPRSHAGGGCPDLAMRRVRDPPRGKWFAHPLDVGGGAAVG